MKTQLWAIGTVAAATLFGALGAIYLKKTSGKLNLRELMKNKNLIIGVLLYGIGTLLFIPSLRGGDLSVIYPIVALTYIWGALLPKKMLGEEMNGMKWTGIVLILLGVSFIGGGRGKKKQT